MLNRRALILVDIQNDFCPGGALAVPNGDEVVPVANKLMNDFNFEQIICTKDWHPVDHGSFAINHPGKQPFMMGELAGEPQMMWPAHCVQNTPGANLHPDLVVNRDIHYWLKGTDANIDSYSGFYDNGRKKSTMLAEFLRERNIEQVIVMGLATDYCVKATAIDAVSEGFETGLYVAGCRGITPDGVAAAMQEMKDKGVVLI